MLSVKLLPSWAAFRMYWCQGLFTHARLCISGWTLSGFCQPITLAFFVKNIDFSRNGDKIKKNNSRGKCYSIFHKNSTRVCTAVPEYNHENFLLLPCRLESSLIQLTFPNLISLCNIRKLYLRVLEVHTNGMRTSCIISGTIMSIYLCV